MLGVIEQCTKCPLHKNQKPLLQADCSPVDVVIVGLSAVKCADVACEEPLSARTRSGRLIREISSALTSKKFYFTNLVKCLPLKEGRIRYPTSHELGACFPNLKIELETVRPAKIILLGKQVSQFFEKELSVSFKSVENQQTGIYNGIKILAVPHPSYILIYKRKEAESYADAISNFVSNE